MTDTNTLVELYIASWNEPDPARRQGLIEQILAEDIRYTDPLMQSEGHSGFDLMLAGAQAQFPGLRFKQVGRMDTHNEAMRFSWELAPPDGSSVAGGTDFATLSDGRFKTIIGFLDFAPGA